MNTRFIGMIFIFLLIVGFFVLVQVARPDCSTGSNIRCEESKVTPQDIRLKLRNSFNEPIGISSFGVMYNNHNLECFMPELKNWGPGKEKDIILTCANMPPLGKNAMFNFKIGYYTASPGYAKYEEGYLKKKVE